MLILKLMMTSQVIIKSISYLLDVFYRRISRQWRVIAVSFLRDLRHSRKRLRTSGGICYCRRRDLYGTVILGTGMIETAVLGGALLCRVERWWNCLKWTIRFWNVLQKWLASDTLPYRFNFAQWHQRVTQRVNSLVLRMHFCFCVFIHTIKVKLKLACINTAPSLTYVLTSLNKLRWIGYT